MSFQPVLPTPASRPGPPPQRGNAATDALEAAFLEQMLTPMGMRAREGTLSGGAGESQFHSFLQQRYAQLLSERIDLRIGEAAR